MPGRKHSRIERDTKVQFRLIKEIDSILRRARIRYWLRGGWALDFLLGEITTSHSDIDLVTWKRHAQRIRHLLTVHGYRALRTRIPETQMNFSKRSQHISIVFVKKSSRKRILAAGIEEWLWGPGAFPARPKRLGKLSCRVISPKQLLQEKESYEQATGRAVRRKDQKSIRALRLLVSRRGGRAFERRPPPPKPTLL